jgi:hypothetical protein
MVTADCCPRAASGQAAHEPPRSVMNSRRLTSSTGLPPDPPRALWPVNVNALTQWQADHAILFCC